LLKVLPLILLLRLCLRVFFPPFFNFFFSQNVSPDAPSPEEFGPGTVLCMVPATPPFPVSVLRTFFFSLQVCLPHMFSGEARPMSVARTVSFLVFVLCSPRRRVVRGFPVGGSSGGGLVFFSPPWAWGLTNRQGHSPLQGFFFFMVAPLLVGKPQKELPFPFPFTYCRRSLSPPFSDFP